MNEKTSTAGVGADGPQNPADPLLMLRHWLANEDVYTSPYVRKWLERAPPDEAADILAQIAEAAQPEPHSLFHMALDGFMMMFTTAQIISDKTPAGRKAGTRAAMLLANRNDPRSLVPLTRVFETSSFWQGRYQEAVEVALLQFLSKAASNPEISRYAAEVRSLAERTWNFGSGRRELSPRRADLLIAALRCLQTIGGEANLALLQSVAAAKAIAPNRARVKEAAASILNSSN